MEDLTMKANIIYFDTHELLRAKTDYLTYLLESDAMSHFNGYQKTQIIFEIYDCQTVLKLDDLKLKFKSVFNPKN